MAIVSRDKSNVTRKVFGRIFVTRFRGVGRIFGVKAAEKDLIQAFVVVRAGQGLKPFLELQ
jgi:hypothetical protein